MKKIWTLYYEDLKNIFSHYAAIIVIVALCILPSLYAWFNIKASWDPYGEKATSQIQVAIVNNDEGVQQNGTTIDIGNTVVESLKENQQLGWQFVNDNEAKRGLAFEKYYASIEIPHDFSKNLVSFFSNEIQKPTLIYRVNEKINAIAPKLTAKGASALQNKIVEEIMKTAADVVFQTSNQFAEQLDLEKGNLSSIYQVLEQTQERFQNINEILSKSQEAGDKSNEFAQEVKEQLPMISDALSNLQQFITSMDSYAEQVQGIANEFAPSIKNDIQFVAEVAHDVKNIAATLKDTITSSQEQLPIVVEGLRKKVASLKTMNSSILKMLKTLQMIHPNAQIKEAIASLQMMNQQLDELDALLANFEPTNTATLIEKIDRILEITTKIETVSNQIYQNFDSTILVGMQEIFQQMHHIAQDFTMILNDVQKKIPQAREIIELVQSGLEKGGQEIVFAKEKLPIIESIFSQMVTKLRDAKQKDILNKTIHMLKGDVAERADFIANPVKLKEERMYPIANYGTGMTPFYTVLSLWVGALLLCSILKVHHKQHVSSKQEYFSKLLLFLSIAIIQALIVACGDLWILKITCAHPLVFILGCVFTSITFVFIVYTLVSVFGNVGKVIAIVLLVLQVAASGGTFPIQLTPPFFQAIHPFLPFTYFISFAREAIGGIVWEVLLQDSFIGVLYIAFAILIAIGCKQKINQISQGFVKNSKSSGLFEG